MTDYHSYADMHRREKERQFERNNPKFETGSYWHDIGLIIGVLVLLGIGAGFYIWAVTP